MTARPGAERLLRAAVAGLPGAAERAGQVRMAAAVARAAESGEHLLVQAGTGTGKSLAYLAGVLSAGRRAVVATATLALQAQLVHVDAPRMLDAAAPLLGRRPRSALLKGRANYLCLLQLNAGGDGAAPTLDDAAPAAGSRLGEQFRRLREWSESTATGDRDELDWAPADAVWRAASVTALDCVGATRCPYGERCFAEAARARARSADLVVTNHSLLALELLTEGQVLPPHDVVVVDEAHELADRVTAQATEQLTDGRIRQAVARARGLLPAAAGERLEDAAAGVRAALAGTAPARLVTVPLPLQQALVVLGGAASDAAAAIPPAADGDPTATARRQQAAGRLLAVTDVARRVVALDAADVCWVGEDRLGERVLSVAPLDVADALQAGLFTRRPVIATSATLAVGGSFEPVARTWGLAPDGPRWRGLDVGSPFDYRRQARLYVARALPAPARSSELGAEALAELAELLAAAGGRTLGLFTSRRAAEAAALAMRAQTDLPVLLQGDAPLPALVATFRGDARTCLFGTLSLWQGVDAPGPACTLVVIDRIPFERPDDPLAAARAAAVDARGGSGFAEVSLVRAAVRLAQGAGRLIRASGDRGVVAVLDPRLATRRYGETLRRSLPPFGYPTERAAALEWLRRLDASAPPLLPVPPRAELERELVEAEVEAGAGEAGEG